MTHQLQVDWPRCQARGLCYELLPEVVALDDAREAAALPQRCHVSGDSYLLEPGRY